MSLNPGLAVRSALQGHLRVDSAGRWEKRTCRDWGRLVPERQQVALFSREAALAREALSRGGGGGEQTVYS